VDALFGLPRKKSAGTSHRDPLHGSLFFGDQAAVDEYVAAYKMPRKNVPKVRFPYKDNNTKTLQFELKFKRVRLVLKEKLIYFHMSIAWF